MKTETALLVVLAMSVASLCICGANWNNKLKFCEGRALAITGCSQYELDLFLRPITWNKCDVANVRYVQRKAREFCEGK